MVWPAFDGLPLDAVVTTRKGGRSTGSYAGLNLGLHVGDSDQNVLANRAVVASALNATPADMVFCEQAHRPNVVVVTEEHRGRGADSTASALPQTDAMVTTVPGIILVVMVADCVPVVLFDPVARVLGCVHAGWGGTVRGVSAATVEQMRTLGADPTRIVVGVGPSIHPSRYQVGADVVEMAAAQFPGQVDRVARPDGNGKWLFDLWEANVLQLTGVGVPAGQIHVAALDTGPGTPFFSHRSEAPCGRFAALARIHPAQ
jgi:YfiH family protein